MVALDGLRRTRWPLRKIYTLKHTTRTVRAMVTDLRYRLDVHTLHRDDGRHRAGAERDRPRRRCGPRRRCSPTTTAATGSPAASC